MAENPETTGTTESTPQGALTSGTADPTPAGGTGEDLEALKAERDRYKAAHEQWLREKSNTEEERRQLREERANLERERGGIAPPTAVDPNVLQWQRDLELAQTGDAEAMIRLQAAGLNAVLQRVDASERRLVHQRELDSITDKAMREEVERRCKATPGLSPYWAKTQIEAETYHQERAKLEERQRKLDEEEAARRKGRVDVTTTGIPGADLKSANYTPQTYGRDVELAEKGDRQARQRLREFDEGRRPMTPG